MPDSTEVYYCAWQEEPPDIGEFKITKLLIGCPECKVNKYARFKDSGYEGPCGYRNDSLNIATLLSS